MGLMLSWDAEIITVLESVLDQATQRFWSAIFGRMFEQSDGPLYGIGVGWVNR